MAIFVAQSEGIGIHLHMFVCKLFSPFGLPRTTFLNEFLKRYVVGYKLEQIQNGIVSFTILVALCIMRHCHR